MEKNKIVCNAQKRGIQVSSKSIVIPGSEPSFYELAEKDYAAYKTGGERVSTGALDAAWKRSNAPLRKAQEIMNHLPIPKCICISNPNWIGKVIPGCFHDDTCPMYLPF